VSRIFEINVLDFLGIETVPNGTFIFVVIEQVVSPKVAL
jgi:hypothetical protein